MGKAIWHWLNDQTPCAKKLVAALSETLLNAADNYAPKTIHNSAHVVSATGGFGHLTMEWELDIEGAVFDRFEMAVKQILLRDCDVWKYINVPYQKAFAAVSDDNFLTNFEYHVCQAGPTAMALYPKIKAATYDVVQTYRDDDGDSATHLMVKTFIDQYEYRFKSQTTEAAWKIKPTFIDAKYLPRWREGALIAVGDQGFAFGIKA